MNGFNFFLGLGRVGNDPQITSHNGKNGQFITARFLLMTTRTWNEENADTSTGEVTNNKREVTEPIVIQASGRQAETIQKYLKKGDPVCIEGRFDLNSYEDKNTHEKKQNPQIIVTRIHLIPKASGDTTPAQDAKAALALITEAELEGVTDLLGLKRFLSEKTKKAAPAPAPVAAGVNASTADADPF